MVVYAIGESVLAVVEIGESDDDVVLVVGAKETVMRVADGSDEGDFVCGCGVWEDACVDVWVA